MEKKFTEYSSRNQKIQGPGNGFLTCGEAIHSVLQ